ncbi:MAG: hypothetical protein HC893_15635 [Chloroflexaceae bacterium]|nr:hypothetical protein [Chloroflexaceae bacterium]
MFREGEQVWRVDAQYRDKDLAWIVDFLRQGPQGHWLRQRYKYDVPTGVIYFWGATPVPDGELRQLRRAGIRIVL